MKKIFLLISIYILGIQVVVSQNFDANFDFDYKKNFIWFGSYTGSNPSVINPFSKDFFLSGFIDDKKKNKVLDILSDENIFYFNSDNHIFYTPNFKKVLGCENLLFSVGITNKVNTKIHFTKDIFKLLFYGNESFKARKSVISPLEYDYNDYQELEFKFTNKKQKDSILLSFGGGISLIKGKRNINVQINDSYLYTSELGDSIDFKLKMELQSSNADKKEITAVNGMGAGINLHFYRMNKKTQNSIFVSLDDLNLIFWDNKSNFVSFDTNLYFKGWELKDSMDFGGETFIDSLINDLEKGKKQKYNTLLLPKIQIAYFIGLPKSKFDLQLGAGLNFLRSFVPNAYMLFGYQLSKEIKLRTGALYDGVKSIGINLSAKLNLKEKLFVNLGTNQLGGWLGLKKYAAQDVYLQVGYKF